MYDPYQGYSQQAPPRQQYPGPNNYSQQSPSQAPPPPPHHAQQQPSPYNAAPQLPPPPRQSYMPPARMQQQAPLMPPPPPGFIPPPMGLNLPPQHHAAAAAAPPPPPFQQAYGPPLHVSPPPPRPAQPPGLQGGNYGDYNRPRGDPAREHLPPSGQRGRDQQQRERERDNGWSGAPQRRRSASPPMRGAPHNQGRPPIPQRDEPFYAQQQHQPFSQSMNEGTAPDQGDSYGPHTRGGPAGRGRGGSRGGAHAGRNSEHGRGSSRRDGPNSGPGGPTSDQAPGRTGPSHGRAVLNSDLPPDEHANIIQERKNRERPCRTLFVRNVKFGVTSEEIRSRFEAFGDVKTFFDMLERRGMAFVTFYDIRAAEMAKDKLNEVRIANRPIDVHYSLPRDLDITQRCDKEKNQGTLSVAILDARGPINDAEIYARFGAFGQFKAVTPRPDWSGARLVEFFDSRAAERALDELNGAPMAGGRIDADFDWDPLPAPAPEPERPPPSGYMSGPLGAGAAPNYPAPSYGGAPPQSGYGGPPPITGPPQLAQGNDYNSRPGPGPSTGSHNPTGPVLSENQLEAARKVQALLAQLGGGPAAQQSPAASTSTMPASGGGGIGPQSDNPIQGGASTLPPAIAALLASNRATGSPAGQQQPFQPQQLQQPHSGGYGPPSRGPQGSPTLPAQSSYQQQQQQQGNAPGASGAAPAQVQALLDMLARQNPALGSGGNVPR